MNTDWQDAINFVLESEGGYGNDPADPGGETFRGIARNRQPNWIGWKDIDERKKTPGFPEETLSDPAMTDLVKGFYYSEYWLPCKCDELPRAYAIPLFDSAVNQGVGTAIKILQRALGGLSVDGVIGPKTMAAVMTAKPRRQDVFLAQRLVQYHDLMSNRPQLKVFALNWFHRVISLAKLVGSGQA